MSEKRKRKWGDRRDGFWVKDVPGLNTVMMHLFPNRTDSEVYLHDKVDVTEVMQFLAKKNEGHQDYKTTKRMYQSAELENLKAIISQLG